MKPWHALPLSLLLFGVLTTAKLSAQPTQAASKQDLDQPPKIAAMVDGYPISTTAAQRLLKQSLPNHQRAAQEPVMIETAIARLIDRRVVYQYLVANGGAAGKNAVQVEVDGLKRELATIEQSWDGYLVAQQLTREELEFEIEWKISWNRYLQTSLTDEFLEQHFQQHQRQFDDSEMRVAHLLIKTDDRVSVDQALAKATGILADLDANIVTWDEAVSKHSAAPTRNSGGEMGWIRYDEPMPQEFSTAAFRLAVGEISPPVATAFGIHLIKCLELRTGKTGWRDALDRVREHATRSLFEKLATEHRSKVSIKIQP